MEVRPAYSPEEDIWFTDDGLTAKRLSELAVKLPEGDTIADYWPFGYGNVTAPRPPELVKVSLKEAEQITRAPTPRYRSPSAVMTSTGKKCFNWEDREAELTQLVRDGLTAEQIGNRFGISGNAVLGKIGRTPGLVLARATKGSGSV